MKLAYFVVDDFFGDMALVRKDIAKKKFSPKRDLTKEASEERSAFALSAGRKVGRILARPVKWAWQERLRGCGSYRRTRTRHLTHPKAQFIHCDYDLHTVAIIYLSPPESCHGGTRFYRHKATGLCGMHDMGQLAELLTKRQWPLEKLKKILEEDGLHPNRWEVVGNVEMQENRALIFDGRFFHGLYLPPGKLTRRQTRTSMIIWSDGLEYYAPKSAW